MNGKLKLFGSWVAVVAACAALAAAALLGLRHAGLLVGLELSLYDQFVRWSSPSRDYRPPIALI